MVMAAAVNVTQPAVTHRADLSMFNLANVVFLIERSL